MLAGLSPEQQTGLLLSSSRESDRSDFLGLVSHGHHPHSGT